MKFSIFDIDGCLSKDLWRFKQVDQSLPKETRYDFYNSMCIHDAPAHSLTLKNCAEKSKILLITAREEKFRKQTLDWFFGEHKIIIPNGQLLMRPSGNVMPSVELKKFLLSSFISMRADGLMKPPSFHCAFDDREEIVEMYERVFNIRSFVLRAEEYERTKND